MINIRDKVW